LQRRFDAPVQVCRLLVFCTYPSILSPSAVEISKGESEVVQTTTGRFFNANFWRMNERT